MQEVWTEIVTVGPGDPAAIFQTHLAKIENILEHGGNPLADEGLNINHRQIQFQVNSFKRVLQK